MVLTSSVDFFLLSHCGLLAEFCAHIGNVEVHPINAHASKAIILILPNSWLLLLGLVERVTTRGGLWRMRWKELEEIRRNKDVAVAEMGVVVG